MAESCDIIVSGHICLDLFPDLAHVPADALNLAGSLTETGPLAISTGGAVSNTGLALHRLGERVGFMAAVGDDLLGQMIVSYLRTHDARLADLITVRAGEASSYSVVLAPQNRDRSFLHFPGTNATFGADQVDYAALDHARIFHLGYPPLMPRLIADRGHELCQIYSRAKARGVVTSMDMVVPDPKGPSGRADWRGILQNVLPYVDVFLPSIDEAIYLLRREDFGTRRALDQAYLHELAGELLDLGVVVAGFKLGELGLYLRTADEKALGRLSRLPVNARDWKAQEHWQPAYRVDVAGTTGAGDAAYAGFLSAMRRGLPPHACLQLASAVGACNVERIDATSGVQSWDETVARLEQGWPVRAERLRGRSGHLPESSHGQNSNFYS